MLLSLLVQFPNIATLPHYLRIITYLLLYITSLCCIFVTRCEHVLVWEKIKRQRKIKKQKMSRNILHVR